MNNLKIEYHKMRKVKKELFLLIFKKFNANKFDNK